MSTPRTSPQITLTGEPADVPFPFPDPGDIHAEYLESPELEFIAGLIINRYDRFDFMQEGAVDEMEIRYVWQKSGADGDLGWCSKSNPKLHFFTGVDYVIGVNLEQVLIREFTHLQLEALLFHELCHIAVEVNKKGEAKRKIAKHDRELFADEVRFYGLWEDTLKPIAQAFKQMPLMSKLKATDEEAKAVMAEYERAVEHDRRRPTPIDPAVRDFHDSMQKLADEDGTSVTLSTAGKSVTIGPRSRTVNGETFRYDPHQEAYVSESGEILDPLEVPRAAAGGR